MSVRSPDTEALENAVRAAADSLTGYLILSEKRDVIQNRYAEHDTGLMSVSNVSHEGIRSSLEEFADDGHRDIEHIADEAYFVNPFTGGDDSSQEIIDRIEEMYRSHIAFSGETLRRNFDLPIDYADHFINSLEQRNLTERLSRTHDIYTIGSRLQQKSEEPGIRDRLEAEAKHGIITNERFEEIIDAPAIPPVTNMFERDNHIIDLDGKYLVPSAIDDYEQHLARQLTADVEREFDGPVMLESTFENEVKNHATGGSTELSTLSASRRNEILDGVESNVREQLGIESESVDGTSIVVLSSELEDTVREKAEEIYPRVAEEDHAVAETYYENAKEEVGNISTEGGEMVNEYLRSAVLEEVWTRIQEEKFGRKIES